MINILNQKVRQGQILTLNDFGLSDIDPSVRAELEKEIVEAMSESSVFHKIKCRLPESLYELTVPMLNNFPYTQLEQRDSDAMKVPGALDRIIGEYTKNEYGVEMGKWNSKFYALKRWREFFEDVSTALCNKGFDEKALSDYSQSKIEQPLPCFLAYVDLRVQGYSAWDLK